MHQKTVATRSVRVRDETNGFRQLTQSLNYSHTRVLPRTKPTPDGQHLALFVNQLVTCAVANPYQLTLTEEFTLNAFLSIPII